MNITKNTLKSIIGNKLPKTALSFHTFRNEIYFLNGKNIRMTRTLSKVQIKKLKEANLFGQLGWSLN